MDGRRTKTSHKTSPEQSAIFRLVREINKTNAKNVTSIPCFLTDRDHLRTHLRYIYKTNLFTKFHDDWANNVTSRVKLPPPTSHVIQRTGTIFELNSDWTKNVTSRVFTCFHYIHIEKNAPPTGGHVFSPIWTIIELVRDINKTNVLTNFHDDWAKIVTSRVLTRPLANNQFHTLFPICFS
ncbi:hypothetical protein DPMN_053976 [Dreissena polymorpha]|uniref:Uncharacterized protein n=1 Tax=Dreissena polymorpha TaxID=45954 RepID=A0A9D4CPQ0_DREPO|nr:hypothetical protein DPMN_053976 [Dreissena polymorpha]